MNKINLLGINVKCNNNREERLVNIIKTDVKNFYREYKDKPYIVEKRYYSLFSKIETLYFMTLINSNEFVFITDRLFEVYIFTEDKARNYK